MHFLNCAHSFLTTLGAQKIPRHNRYFTIGIGFPDLPKSKNQGHCPTMEFVVDTAASNTLISQKPTTILGAKETGIRATGTTATGSISGGQRQVLLGTGVCKDIQNRNLVLGPVAAVSLPITPFDYETSGVAGILGLDVLSRFDIVFEFLKDQLHFYPPGSLRLHGNMDCIEGLTRLDMTQIPGVGLWHIPVKIVDVEKSALTSLQFFPGIIDTGAAGSVFNLPAATLGEITLDRSNAGVVSGVGQGFVQMYEKNISLRVAGFHTQAGTLTIENVGIADLPIFASIFPGQEAAGVIGLDVLAGGPKKKFALSTTSKTIWLDI